MSVRARGCALALFAGLWAIAGILGGEALSRVLEAREEEGLSLAVRDMLQEIRLAEQEYIWEHYPRVPDSESRGVTPRHAFHALEEDAREEFANTWRELAIVCDEQGVVQTVYGEVLPPEVLELAERIQPGDDVTGLLEGEQRADARRSLRDVFYGPQTFIERWYDMPLASGESNNFAWIFYPESRDGVREIVVFIRNSLWIAMGRQFRPNAYEAHFADGDEVSTNRFGFRDRDVETPPPAGVFRIVCIGGSTTAEGRRNDLTYPRFLERHLRARLGTDSIEVINCGVYALSSEGELERIKDALALQPHLVLHYNFVNDFNLVMDEAYRRAAWTSAPILKIQEMLRDSALIRRYWNAALVPPASALERAIDATYIETLAEMAEMAASKGADFAISSFAYPDPAIFTADDHKFFNFRIAASLGSRRITASSYARVVDAYNRRVEAFCRARGLLYLPVAENFSAGRGLFTDICHKTAAGLDRRAALKAAFLEDAVAAGLGGI